MSFLRRPRVIVLLLLLFLLFSLGHHHLFWFFQKEKAFSWWREVFRLGLLATALLLGLSLLSTLSLFTRGLLRRPSLRRLGAFFFTWVFW